MKKNFRRYRVTGTTIVFAMLFFLALTAAGANLSFAQSAQDKSKNNMANTIVVPVTR